MPLRDHFRDPVKRRLPYTSLHSGWATYLASNLVEHWLPSPFIAVEHTYFGSEVEIDVAAYEMPEVAPSSNGESVTTQARTWVAPPPRATAPFEFSETVEVLVYSDEDRWTLVGAIEIVSEKNKDRPARRTSFVNKCAGFLERGVSVLVIDIVTNRRANLHNQILSRLGIADAGRLAPGVSIYSSAYRPVQRDERTELDVWAEPCVVGEALPTMPLRLTGDLIVPVEFESTYQEICRRRGLT